MQAGDRAHHKDTEGSLALAIRADAYACMHACAPLTLADSLQAVDGEWNIPKLTKDAYDLKGKTVGTVAAGRIGCHVIKRLKAGLSPTVCSVKCREVTALAHRAPHPTGN